MFNPFVRFEPHYTDRILRDNKRYLVTQSYPRADDPLQDEQKINILITDYGDIDYARIHRDSLKDKYKSIIDLKNAKHRAKFDSMLADDSHYRVWWSFVKNTRETDRRLNMQFRDKIKRYIERQTNWRIGGEESIQPRLECIFGELFINLKRGGQKIKVNFEDIENA